MFFETLNCNLDSIQFLTLQELKEQLHNITNSKAFSREEGKEAEEKSFQAA